MIIAKGRAKLGEYFTPHAGSILATGKAVVVGVCDLWSIAKPTQNWRKRARSLISR